MIGIHSAFDSTLKGEYVRMFLQLLVVRIKVYRPVYCPVGAVCIFTG
jgi:hypothetical protein